MRTFDKGPFIVWSILAVVIAALALLVVTVQRSSANNKALWRIVHDICVPNMLTNHSAFPCTSVDLSHGQANGFAILKDRRGDTQYLLVPTGKITGIESFAAWGPGATNYFAEAWTAIALISQRVHRPLPRTDFALAVNSVSGRSQDQLHIHIDCIRSDIKMALAQSAPQLGMEWQTLPTKLRGHEYRALWLPGEELGDRNPFRLLASSLASPSEEMGSHTLVLVGAEKQGAPGFVLLDGKAAPLATAISQWISVGSGSGEELEDHNCQVGRSNQR